MAQSREGAATSYLVGIDAGLRIRGGKAINSEQAYPPEASYPFTIDSDIDLGAQLAACRLETGADVTIREGQVPETIEASAEGVAYQIRPGEALIKIPDGSRLLVTQGREITYQRGPQNGDRDMVLFILGTAWGALCFQRGLIPIHASANIVDGRIIAFTGHSGAGKSTLAANLARRGLPFFTDDTLIFDPSLDEADGTRAAMCYAGQKRLKLWGDALETTGATALDPVREFHAIDKHYAVPPRQSELRLAPLDKLFVLGVGQGDAREPNRLETLRGAAALRAIRRNLYREHFAEVLLGRSVLFLGLKKLVETVEVHHFIRTMSPDNYDPAIDFIGARIQAEAEVGE